MVKTIKGFTLIELMIVVAIIAILAAIAYPSYQEYVRKTKRIESQAELIALAGQLQRYKVANFSFEKREGNQTAPITLADLGHNAVLPNSGDALYDVSLTDVTANAWTLTAMPKSNTAQIMDGTFRLNHRDQRCWDKGKSSCVLSEISNWNGK